MRSLLWKEWHEQRWKVAYGSLILASFALIGLRARVIADETLLESVCLLAVVLLPMLASTGLVPAERNDGTLESLLSLPVRPWKIYIAKTLMGLALCIGPVLVTAIVSLLVAGGREMSAGSMIGLYGRTLAAVLFLFFWMFALSVRLPTETRAALITLGVLIGWAIVTVGLSTLVPAHAYFGPVEMPSKWWLISPFVFLLGFHEGHWAVSLAVAAMVQAVIAIALWLWAATQLAREA